MRDVQLKRKPYSSPRLVINPEIQSLRDIETWVSLMIFQSRDISTMMP